MDILVPAVGFLWVIKYLGLGFEFLGVFCVTFFGFDRIFGNLIES